MKRSEVLEYITLAADTAFVRGDFDLANILTEAEDQLTSLIKRKGDT